MASMSVLYSAIVAVLFTVMVGIAMARVPGSRVVRSETDENEDMEIIRVCNASSPISRDAMNTVLINKQLYGNEADNFKCFLHCLYTKYNWMDEVGGFHLRIMKDVLQKSHLASHVVEMIIYKCSAIPAPDKCERAYQFTECFWAETDKYPEQEEPPKSDLNLFDY